MGISFIVLLKTRFLRAVLFFLSLTAFYSCSEPSSPFGQTEITLTVLDASCTEVWLELKFSNLTQPADVAIKKDGSEIARFLSVNKDTVLYVDSLLPSQSFNFGAVIRYDGKDDRTSNSAVVTTMDTTSHNFSWQTWEFGQHSSSVLYDVTIINDNNIWAVGEIYMNDVPGDPIPNLYNAVHWDGVDWTLHKIWYNGSFWSITAVSSVDENDIWYSVLMRYKQGTFTQIQLIDLFIGWKIFSTWCNSSQELYASGSLGKVIYFNGSAWEKIETGFNCEIHDLIGVNNRLTGRQEIFCAAADFYEHSFKQIFKINPDLSITAVTPEVPEFTASIWSATGTKLYTAGYGLHIWTNHQWESSFYPGYPVLTAIRGNAANDIFVAGSFGFLAHYNGSTWVETTVNPQAQFSSIAMKNNTVAAAGFKNGKAYIALGKRN